MEQNTGCLIIHGFGGNVGEVQTLCQYMKEKGYLVRSPTLKDHTGKRKDLRGVKYNDWIKTAEDSLLELQEKCNYLFVIGFSMGGLIAINLATKYEIDAIITINTPIYYWDFKRIMLNILDDVKKRNLSYLRRYINSSSSVPLSALLNFKSLLEHTKPKIKGVKFPFLIIQALDDDTVRKTSANFIYNNLASIDKHIKFYESGGHLILQSVIANKVIADIDQFLIETRNKY